MRFTSESQDIYLGPVDSVAVGHAADPAVHEEAASGGVVTALLLEALESGEIEGAVLTRTKTSGGRVEAESFLARTAEEILASRGSVYVASRPLEVLDDVLACPGRVGFVGLPCDVAGLRARCASEARLAGKIAFVVGLFCGHNSRRDVIEGVLRRERIDEARVAGLRFRRGHWRGRMRVRMDDGEVREFPFQRFSVYQNLHFFSEPKCLSCDDHCAESADISCGDIWRGEMKGVAVKPCVVVARSPEASERLKRLRDNGVLDLDEATPRDVFLAQKRSLIHHKNLAARARLAPFFGLGIRRPGRAAPTRWNDWLSAFIMLSSYKLSTTRLGARLIWVVPRRVWWVWLATFKLLTNF